MDAYAYLGSRAMGRRGYCWIEINQITRLPGILPEEECNFRSYNKLDRLSTAYYHVVFRII